MLQFFLPVATALLAAVAVHMTHRRPVTLPRKVASYQHHHPDNADGDDRPHSYATGPLTAISGSV
jgi:hypothetical protein